MNQKSLAPFFFMASVIAFTILYFSFFPGRYTVDSYSGYATALGEADPIDVYSPVFTLFWTPFWHYNFSPMLLNYLVLVASLTIMYWKTKSTCLPQIIILCFLSPFLFLCYVFIWKDNALLTVLLLLSSALINHSPAEKHLKNISIPHVIFIFSLFILATSLRVNAIFAVIPLIWFYVGNFTSKLSRQTLAFLLSLVCVIEINHVITYHGFHAKMSTYIQQIYTTDVIKINHLLKEPFAIPQELLHNTEPNNIKKIFDQYQHYHSNDYFYFQLMPNFNPLIKMTEDRQTVKQLKDLWLKTITHHPLAYLQIRFTQWIGAIYDVNYIYGENFNINHLYHGQAHIDRIFYEPKNAWMTTIRNHYQPSYLHQFSVVRLIFNLSRPLIYFILSICFALYLLINRKTTPNKRLTLAILTSGIVYIAGYLPILPACDYRYFTWVIFAFWFAIGLYLTDIRQAYRFRVLRNL